MQHVAAVRWEEAGNVLEEFVCSSSRLGEHVLKLVQCLFLQAFVFYLQQQWVSLIKASHVLLRTKSNRIKRLFPQNLPKWECYNRLLTKIHFPRKHTTLLTEGSGTRFAKSSSLTVNLLNFLDAVVSCWSQNSYGILTSYPEVKKRTSESFPFPLYQPLLREQKSGYLWSPQATI